MKLGDGNAITFKPFGDVIEVMLECEIAHVAWNITKAEAIEIAAELVKLAMPDAKPDTAPVSIM